MLKTLEAWLRGYVVFRVNGEKFLLYSRAKEKRKFLTEYTKDHISFEGYHIFKSWIGFYYRF
jgi:hypothetical protein